MWRWILGTWSLEKTKRGLLKFLSRYGAGAGYPLAFDGHETGKLICGIVTDM